MCGVSVRVEIVKHPLIQDSLSRVRDRSTPNALFRQELERVGLLLMVEATKGLDTIDTVVETPLASTTTRTLATQPVVVPILRAGLGLLPAAQELLPAADVGFVGMSRDEESFSPVPYVTKLPESLAGRVCIVLDPMLATGGSMAHTCRLLKDRGAIGPITIVCVLASPEGLSRLESEGLELIVYTASVDEHLNDDAFIVPGLGDAGDRLFGEPK